MHVKCSCIILEKLKSNLANTHQNVQKFYKKSSMGLCKNQFFLKHY